MSKRTVVGSCFCAVLCLVAAGAMAVPSFDELVEEMAGHAEEMKSWSADMVMTMAMGPMTMKLEGSTQGKGDMSATVLKSIEGPMEMETKAIVDAEGTQWSETTVMGRAMVMKATAEELKEMGEDGASAMGAMASQGEMDPKEMLKQMSKAFDMTVAGEEDLNGVPVYVLEGTPKENAEGNPATAALKSIQVKVGKKDGFVRSMTTSGEGGPAMTMVLTNVKINPELADSVFAYTPPADTPVMSLKDMGAMMGAGPGGGGGMGAPGGMPQ